MQKIVPFLWFDKEAEEAMNFYVEVFNNSPGKRQDSKIVNIMRYEEGMETPGIEGLIGKVLTGEFELEGQRYMCLDGGPIFKFNEAISLYIECADQAEADYFYDKLSAVPEAEQCGWIKDKYGLGWQLVPKRYEELVNSPDRKKAIAAINAMLKMKRINIAEMEEAYNKA